MGSQTDDPTQHDLPVPSELVELRARLEPGALDSLGILERSAERRSIRARIGELEADLVEECDSCGGRFDTTMDPRIEAECDSQMQDLGEFKPGPMDRTFCENDGWMMIEHDLGRNLVVHESCFLDHDDILERV